ncbi:unnamed protein product [Aphanomyces euteiches]|uniref:FYVE-type domain-containing protein n=1 Tax=Aphanomyces euteiches TaxID=100861 RepID=A0A6G0XW64_9STRA|nr:hypothetical protein Ae201684_001192 [Aphanomyces euteiches]KAH9099850.1 hypothetical protein Ae201684P_018859 [Aphanomyces euteiches]KAH9152081.1 hypothetical protein AeRB84_005439 [Aphanomyces euteiches]
MTRLSQAFDVKMSAKSHGSDSKFKSSYSKVSSVSESVAAAEATTRLSQLLDDCTGDGRYAVEWTKLKDKGDALQLWKGQSHERGFSLHGVQDIPASITEVCAFFTPRLTSSFKANMKLLHGPEFVDGAIESSSSMTMAPQSELFSTSMWCAFKSKALLGKDKGFTMHTAAQIFHPPVVHMRTLVYVMTPRTSRSLPHRFSCAEWTFGVVIEEVSPQSLRMSCRCSSSEASLCSMATGVVWRTLSNLPEAISTFKSSTTKSLVSQAQWVEDHYRSECHQCHADFTTFRRRHHCRTCGEIVCSSCSTRQVAALARGPLKVRMCSGCVASLNGSNQPRESQMTRASSGDQGRESSASLLDGSLMRIADSISSAARANDIHQGTG